MAGIEQNASAETLAEGGDPLKPVTDATKAGLSALVAYLAGVNAEIVQLDGGVASSANAAALRYEKLRIRALIFSRATAGTTTLTIGTRGYAFTLPGVPFVVMPFPLLIERGTDLSIDGDGRLYIVADPE